MGTSPQRLGELSGKVRNVLLFTTGFDTGTKIYSVFIDNKRMPDVDCEMDK